MVLELNNITKYFAYEDVKQVLFEKMTIRFPDCGLFIINGDSGCGKSTLLNVINGTQEVNEGQIFYNGVDFKQVKNYKQKIVANIYQNSCLINCLTIKENIELFCKIKDIEIDNFKLLEYLKKVQIQDLLDKYPNQCSGGQIQRIGIVRALLCNTPILTCDEPTAALDNDSKRTVIKLLYEYSRHSLVILVTHDCEFAKQCDINFNELKQYYYFKGGNIENKINQNYQYQLDYSKRRLLYDKCKVILMMISQVITIITCSILISGINGTMNYYNDMIDNSLISNQVIIASKNNISFSTDARKYLTKDYTNMFYQDMSRGMINKNNDFRSYMVFNDLKENEVIVNDRFIKEYQVKNNQFTFVIDGKEIMLKIKDIYNNDFLYRPTIYFSDNTFNNNIKKSLIDKTQIVIKVKKHEIEEVIKEYNTNYLAYNEIIDWKDNIQSLYSLAIIVFIIFVSISLIIAVILYYLVFLSILLERKKDYALLICNGLSYKRLKNMVINESSLIILIICVIGGFMSHFFIYCLNSFKVLESITSFKLVFEEIEIFMSNYDIYVVILILYLFVSYFVSLRVFKETKKLDFVSTLKEE